MAATAEPLNNLTRKDTWNWTEECQLAFDTLRETLAPEPVVLRYPRWEQPFINSGGRRKQCRYRSGLL